MLCCVLTSCRLWVVPCNSNDPAGPQQIGYVNIVPARSVHGGFESFGDAVRRFNDQLRLRPLPGPSVFFSLFVGMEYIRNS